MTKKANNFVSIEKEKKKLVNACNNLDISYENVINKAAYPNKIAKLAKQVINFTLNVEIVANNPRDLF